MWIGLRAGSARASLMALAVAALAGACGAPSSSVRDGHAFDTQSTFTEIDRISRVGLTDDSIIASSSLTKNALSPVKVLSVRVLHLSPGLRVLGFVAYRYSQAGISRSSRGRIRLPHVSLVGTTITHATATWWQVELRPERTGRLSARGIDIVYEQNGQRYQQVLPANYVLDVHPATWHAPRS